MNLDEFDQNIDVQFDDVHDDEAGSSSVGIDARRRLEDKIEEMRLAKEIQEFDFDF